MVNSSGEIRSILSLFLFFFLHFLMPFLKLFNREWSNNDNFTSEKNKQAKLFFFHVMICSVFTESTVL